MIQPTSRSAVGFVRTFAAERDIELPARGYVTTREDFTTWAESRGRRRLLMEDFYRDARRRHGVLMEGGEPVGGRWNLDAENREPAPRGQETLGVAEPSWPQEDDIDAEVRDDLDRWERDGDVHFVGRHGPRLFAATRVEARTGSASTVTCLTGGWPWTGTRPTPPASRTPFPPCATTVGFITSHG